MMRLITSQTHTIFNLGQLNQKKKKRFEEEEIRRRRRDSCLEETPFITFID